MPCATSSVDLSSSLWLEIPAVDSSKCRGCLTKFSALSLSPCAFMTSPSPSDGISVRVLFFARARELTGVPSTSLTLSRDTSPRAALQRLVASYPALAPLAPHCALAVNLEYASGDAVLRDGDELAVIPPISGG